jgi:hypothetical protein
MSSGDWAASFCWLQQENPPRKGDSNISQLVDLYRPQLALRSSLAIVNRNSLENCLTCASSYIAGLTECVDLFSFSLSLSLKTHLPVLAVECPPGQWQHPSTCTCPNVLLYSLFVFDIYSRWLAGRMRWCERWKEKTFFLATLFGRGPKWAVPDGSWSRDHSGWWPSPLASSDWRGGISLVKQTSHQPSSIQRRGLCLWPSISSSTGPGARNKWTVTSHSPLPSYFFFRL